MKKNLFTFLILLFSIPIFAQKIGIVYDINPNLGYTHARAGITKFKPITEPNLVFKFNYIDFVSDYLSSKNVDFKIYEDFDFNNLDHLSRDFINKKQISYVNSYCKTKNIDKLIIIKKVNSYKIIDFMESLRPLNYDLGFLSLKTQKKRLNFYYKFWVIEYIIDSKNYGNFLNSSYSSKKFENDLYNDDFTFKNNDAVNYFLNNFKEGTYKIYDQLIRL